MSVFCPISSKTCGALEARSMNTRRRSLSVFKSENISMPDGN